MEAVIGAGGTQTGPLLAALLNSHPFLEREVAALAEAAVADLLRKSETQPAALKPAAPVADVFARLLDVSCGVPRGKHDVEFSENEIRLLSKSTGTTLVVRVASVTGVFALVVQDRYRKGVDGATHAIVLTLSEPVLVGKSPHSVLSFTENGAKLAKSGPCSVELLRPVLADRLKDAAALALPGVLEGLPHSFSALRILLTATCGKIGESDPTVFKSASGVASVPVYNKANEGALFPLRRALVFGLKPLVVCPLSEIASINVGRGGGSGATRTFDLDVHMCDGRVVQFRWV
jgi:hypothetical protein